MSYITTDFRTEQGDRLVRKNFMLYMKENGYQRESDAFDAFLEGSGLNVVHFEMKILKVTDCTVSNAYKRMRDVAIKWGVLRMFHNNDTESIVCISMTSAVALSAMSDFTGDLQTIQIEVGQINEVVNSRMSVHELPRMQFSSKLNACAKEFYPTPKGPCTPVWGL
eukprot:gene28818-32007_t